jgi:methylase of polypeptide subunit release factors
MLVNVLHGVAGKNVLDLGTGTGILAIYAVKNGAVRCTAVDIQAEAVTNTQENVAAYHLEEKIEVIKSDLFDQVTGKYDIIIANLPVMDPEWTELNRYSVQVNQRFFDQVDSYLENDGTAYVSSVSWGDLASLRRMIAEGNFSSREYTEEKRGATWYIFELTRQSATKDQLNCAST